jgi:hypothetical protein
MYGMARGITAMPASCVIFYGENGLIFWLTPGISRMSRGKLALIP